MSPSELLIDARRRAGFTQAELAARLGVNRVTVSRWERLGLSHGHLIGAVQACGLVVEIKLVEERTTVETYEALLEQHGWDGASDPMVWLSARLSGEVPDASERDEDWCRLPAGVLCGGDE